VDLYADGEVEAVGKQQSLTAVCVAVTIGAEKRRGGLATSDRSTRWHSYGGHGHVTASPASVLSNRNEHRMERIEAGSRMRGIDFYLLYELTPQSMLCLGGRSASDDGNQKLVGNNTARQWLKVGQPAI
jgi:hypothetical protein